MVSHRRRYNIYKRYRTVLLASLPVQGNTNTLHRVAAFTLAACSFATNLQSAFVYLLCIKWSDAGLHS